ncbi:AfsR/SARP family transcriptional regulator [Actinomadura sp. 9N215]|uniref:AfsR/SARP family transcriptional regulator n=1 Tax=Actinomadura sp. 9N215 TaxID=3375150 RepID=UPI0037B76EE8
MEVRPAGDAVGLTGRQRAVLGVLLLNANAVVHRDRIVDALWDDPPRSAIANVHSHMSGLRRALMGGTPGQTGQTAQAAQAGQAAQTGLTSLLDTQENGYLLRVERTELDLLAFDDAAENGRVRAEQGDLTGAERELDYAVSLWRGEPFQDVTFSDKMIPSLTELAERRMRTWTLWTDVRIALGAAEELIGELHSAANAHPLREYIWQQLMLVLYRARRRGDALDAYQRARSLLVEELGIEPGPDLQRLHTAILNDDPALCRAARPGETSLARYQAKAQEAEETPRSRPPDGKEDMAGRIRPSELPRAIARFAGRGTEQARLDAVLPAAPAAGTPAGPTFWIVSGIAGVGKTALVVHWAHKVKDAFPDGQLYVNLQGFNPLREPLDPAMALSQLLRSLAIPAAEVPAGVDEREKLYRSVIADRQVLLLLDDARSAEQVRPLLPGHSKAMVLVTSRFQLGDLVVHDGAEPLPLAVLTPEDTRELLAQALGHDRLVRERNATDELARLCGHLPLALSIAAAMLSTSPEEPIASIVDQLGKGALLSELSVDGAWEGTVGSAFQLSYQSLRPEHRRIFRLLGLVPGPMFRPSAVAALAGCSDDDAAKGLKALAASNLIEHHGERVYRIHDLLRQYAADRAEEQETPDGRRQALNGYFSYYLNGADAAGLTISPSTFRLPDDATDRPPPSAGPPSAGPPSEAGAALTWLQCELENLVAVVTHCTTHGPPTFAWRIMDALRPFLTVGIYREEWLDCGRRGLEAAEEAGDRQAQAAMHISLGVACLALGRLRVSELHLERALEASTDSGWLEGEADAVTQLGAIRLRTGDVSEAIMLGRRAIRLYRQRGHLSGEAMAHAVLGYSQWLFGDLPQALRHQKRALSLHERAGNEYGQAICLTELATTLHDKGDHACAVRNYLAAVAICERLGAPARLVRALAGLSRVQSCDGDPADALRNAQRAVTVAYQSRDRRAESSALDAMARACFALRRPDAGREYAEKALWAAERVGLPWDIAHVLIGMAGHCPDDGGLDALGRRALTIAREHGFRLLEGRAAEALVKVHADREAAGWARAALRVYQEIGHAPGTARVQHILGRTAPLR